MGGLFGSSAPAKSDAVLKAEKRQETDLARLTKKEDQYRNSLKRKRRGRGSLISGDERGVADSLGQ
jgi:predicted RNA-binding protein YlxR (DUF448 family)